MEFLNPLSPADQRRLQVLDDAWPVFFLTSYAQFLHAYRHEEVLIAYDDRLDAYMPFRVIRSKFIRPVQILFAPHRNGYELSAGEQSLFFEHLVQKLTRWGKCDRIVQPHPSGLMAAHPAASMHCAYGTYIIDLEHQTDQEILHRFHSKYQKAIRQSAAKPLTLKTGRETLDDFYKLYKATMNRAGMFAEPFEFFKSQYDILGDRHVICCVVYDQQVPLSSLFTIYTRHSALLTHAGTPDEAGMHGATKFLHYEMMKVMKSLGASKYDFVGVRLNNTIPSLEGIFNFKKRFGGDLKTGYLWKADIHPLKCAAFDFLLRLKLGHKRTPDIIDQEQDTPQDASLS